MADSPRFETLEQLARAWNSSESRRPERARDLFSVAIDAISVVFAAMLASALVLHRTGADLWREAVLHPQHLWISAVLVFGFAASVVLNCERFNLYIPERNTSILQEQRHIFQATLTSGLLLVVTVYLLHPRDPRTRIVLTAVVLATGILSVRRLAGRIFLHRSLAKGAGVRNVLIVGTGPTARALRRHLGSMGHLGYTFKGFIASCEEQTESMSSDVVGTLDRLFDHAHSHFVDEILFAGPCAREDVQLVMSEARQHDVNIRLVPEFYESSIPHPQIEYLGEFPTIPLFRRTMPESRLFVKRTMDIVFSSTFLIALLPAFIVIALAIKRDSPGPVFYRSERLGKKGKVFCCLKFRTMVQESESLRAILESRNQRDGILFKLADDPRITRVGRFLRKYSLDELPQFINVLRGEMSIVGPRPPLAGEVKKYKPNHLRRLEVTPGITGLWQVQARNDPSFMNYVSLDVSYIENWSIRLDLEIMVRTIGVVFGGTGL